MTVIELRSAIKRYDQITVDASLRIASGRQLALLGPSGCGKTTILRMIAGLVEIDDGEVDFDGGSVTHMRPEQRGVAMVFQEPTLFPFRTVAENVAYGLKVRRVPPRVRRDRVASCLTDVQLEGFEDRWPHELSGGQRQRVAVARALAVEPRVLLLDEPLTSLEPALRADLRELLSAVQRSHQLTSVFVTHDHAEAQTIADDVAIMLAGQVVQCGTRDEVFGGPVDDRVAGFLGLGPAR